MNRSRTITVKYALFEAVRKKLIDSGGKKKNKNLHSNVYYISVYNDAIKPLFKKIFARK